MKKRYWIGLIFLFLLLFVIIANLDNDAPEPNGNDVPKIDWSSIRANDVAQFSDGWGTPVMASVSSDLWEDGAYISGDGNTLYFAYYPGDILHDVQTMKFKDDIDVYYSQKPFTSKSKHSISKNIWSEGGVMISNGDMYYMSNRGRNDNIYKNNEKIEIPGTGDMEEQDPHYCAEKDELYFWDRNDNKIYVYKNEELSKLPAPINVGSQNIQPFLTEDCQTMYFSSSRNTQRLQIMKSERIDDDSWKEPVVVASSKIGIGEPTLTHDGNTLFFVQIFQSPEGAYNSDIFYVEKK